MENFRERYMNILPNVKMGKRIGYELYFHRSYLDVEAGGDLQFIKMISEIGKQFAIPDAEWNIIKIHKKKAKISFLKYPEFDKDAYPILTKSYSIDLEANKCKVIDYAKSTNPPILHRKELFVPESYPLFAKFKEATVTAEKLGYYSGDSRKIGYRNQWMQFLKSVNESHP
jgi:DNA phosphorothioation-associated putative methyltransferase